jgi:hypothetical protein
MPQVAMTPRTRRFVFGIAALALLARSASTRALPATFVVNSQSDVVGVSPGNHVCETSPGTGTCTLRRAIIEANHWPGGGAVVDLTALPGGVTTLTIPAAGADDETTGDLNINASMTIVGAGAASTVIDADGVVTHDRAFRITTGTVTMSGVTLRNGNVTFADPDFAYQDFGGAIVLHSGTLTLNGVRITNNRDGIFGGGGGVYADTFTTLVVNATTFDGNQDVSQSLMFGGGGGIRSGGSVTLNRTIVSNNTSAGTGGGIAMSGCQCGPATLTIVNSTISGNTGYHGGGLSSQFAVTVIANSTISGNQAQPGYGGGLSAGGSNGGVTLTNVTISGNTTAVSGGGIDTRAPVAVFNSTITANRADTLMSLIGKGGGISNEGTSVTLQNTILAGNFETQLFCIFARCSVVSSVGECLGTITSNGFNLMSNYDTNHCAVAGAVTLADPGLAAALQFNGGPTETHSLTPESFAVDRGDPGGCRDSFGSLLTTDQRGYPRPIGNGRCDIGAYELGTRSLRDFNGNGEADLLWRNPTTGEDGLWEMAGFGVQAAQALPSAGPPWQIAGTGDFDGDGHADILWRNPVTGENGLWLMNGFTIVSAQALPTVTTTWVVAGIGDFNGDGLADILWQDAGTGQAGIWEMNGLALLDSRVISGPTPGWQVVGVADFDGDGRTDLLWRQSATGQAGIWLMNGFTPAVTQLISGNNPAWRIAGTGDFNGDGMADILWRNPTTGENSIWLMSGVTMAGGQAIAGAGVAWQVAVVADFNGDGRADILWRNPTTGDDGLWTMNAFAITGAQAIPGASTAWEIH